jgi:uncharacterized glyoxalase superfamily protein PhnB
MTDPAHNKPLSNRSMPSCTVIPVLEYKDVTRAASWLCKAFGFTERWHAGTHRAQLAVGGGAVVLTEPRRTDIAVPEMTGHAVMVRVQHIDNHYEQARESGARILQAPATFPFGERQYTAADIDGHVWTFSQSVADVAPEDWGGTSAQKK